MIQARSKGRPVVGLFFLVFRFGNPQNLHQFWNGHAEYMNI
jgi:hypothetical protein